MSKEAGHRSDDGRNSALGDHGKPPVAGMEDATPRKRAEEALFKAEALQSAKISQALWVSDFWANP